MYITAYALYLALIHVLFLAALSLRLGVVGYPASTIIRMVIGSLSLWPVVLLIGLVSHLHLLTNAYGLTAILTLTMVYYLFLEARLHLESDAEQSARETVRRDEIAAHAERVAQDQALIGTLFAIKTYLGDDSSLQAISDLGKLKAADIPCRIEGGAVKVLFVRQEQIEAVERVIAIDSAPLDEQG